MSCVWRFILFSKYLPWNASIQKFTRKYIFLLYLLWVQNCTCTQRTWWTDFFPIKDAYIWGFCRHHRTENRETRSHVGNMCWNTVELVIGKSFLSRALIDKSLSSECGRTKKVPFGWSVFICAVLNNNTFTQTYYICVLCSSTLVPLCQIELGVIKSKREVCAITSEHIISIMH